MLLNEKISNIIEASQAAAEFKPIEVPIRRGRQADGTPIVEPVYVDQLPWIDVEPMIERLNGAVNAGVEAWNKREMLKLAASKSDITPMVGGLTSQMADQGAISVEQIAALGSANRADLEAAGSNADTALKAAFGHIQKLPEIAEEWVCACTNTTRDFWHEKDAQGRKLTPAQSFMAVLQVSLLVNYDGPIRDFFDGVLRRFLPADTPPPAPEQAEATAPAPLSINGSPG